MRILIVSFVFPPFNTIGAVRVGKTAKYLRQMGHDVRVLTARDQPWPATLSLEVPEESVVTTKWLNVNRPAEIAAGGRHRVATEGFSAAAGSSAGLKARLGQVYKTFVNLPDSQIGWLLPAIRAGNDLLRQWRADVILSSSPPPTSLIVASRLGSRFSIPWVADLRDLWTDTPYYPFPSWRLWLERALERRVLGTAAGLVTVSEPLRQVLLRKYRIPAASILNGFDPDDYPERDASPSDRRLRIVYTGMLYAGRRDPSPLFQAIRLTRAPEAISVQFFGRYVGSARDLARACGVEAAVETHLAVPYEESLRLQRNADALLLLPGNEPAARGAYTGKFFEYLGARRPLIVISDRENVAAAVVVERNLGVVEADPAALAARLDEWLDVKSRGERLPDLSADSVTDFTREKQVKQLADFLEAVVTGTA